MDKVTANNMHSRMLKDRLTTINNSRIPNMVALHTTTNNSRILNMVALHPSNLATVRLHNYRPAG
jgi:hypothetical protein